MNLSCQKIGAVIVAGLLSPCVASGSPPTLQLPPMQEEVLPVDISLIPYDAGREEFHYRSGKRSKALIVTGAYWTRVFADEGSADVIFELEQTRLSSTLLGMGMGSRSRYEVKGKFSCGGESMDVEEEYTLRCNRRTITTCYGFVVNQALKDLASKGKEFAKRCAKEKANSN